MFLAIGLGVLGFMALRRAHHHRHGCGHHGWHGHTRGWHGHHRNERKRWMFHALLRRIDATPAQERLIVGELDKFSNRLYDARSTLKESRSDLAAAIRNPVLDDAALGAALGRVDAATTEARSAAIDAIRTIHGALDDKQRAEVADLLDRRGGRFWRSGPYR